METDRKKQTSIVSLSLFFILASVTPWLFVAVGLRDRLLAQSTPPVSFSFPAEVPSGTTVRIDGSSSMDNINQALKQRFEEKFPGTNVKLDVRGSDAAIEALLDETIDLAALGRPLTPAEKNRGLVQVPLSRHKIAIIIGRDNPYRGDVTFNEFAKIFRGEIKNWSEIGGIDRVIRPIDRPENSDTRRAFITYDVFKSAPFRAGANARQVDEDSTEEVISRLGKNGIGYAIVDQVAERTDVRIVPMHGVFPDNPKYPFSQTLSYVYKGPNPKPNVSQFLGYATAASNQQIVQEAIAIATPTPDITPSPIVPTETPSADPPPLAASNNTNQRVTNDSKFPWWLLLLLGIPLLGALLWWLFKDKKTQRGSSVAIAPTAAGATTVIGAAAAPTAPPNTTYLFLVPYEGRNAYAHWRLAPAQIEAFQRQGGDNLMLRLYDVTGIPISMRHTLDSLQQFGCELQQQYLLLTLPEENRDYIVELGYFNHLGHWLPMISSGTVRIASIPPSRTVIADTKNGGEATELVTAAPTATASFKSRLFLVPYNGKNAYIYWQIFPAELEALQRQGGEKLRLRLYDVTGIPYIERQRLQSLQQFGCEIGRQYLLLSLPEENRDYMVEMGYLTHSGNWLPLVASEPVRVVGSTPTGYVSQSNSGSETIAIAHSPAPAVTTPANSETIASGHSPAPAVTMPASSETIAIAHSPAPAVTMPASSETIASGHSPAPAVTMPASSETIASGHSPAPAVATAPSNSRLFLVPYDGRNAYVHWQISPAEIEALQRQGGEQLKLRLYDITGIPDSERPRLCSLQQFDCEIQQPYLLLILPTENRDYVVELGLLARSGDWLPLIASAPVQYQLSHR